MSVRQRVLRALREHGPMTSVQVAAMLDVRLAAVKRAVQGLREHGHLEVVSRRLPGERGGPGAFVYAVAPRWR